MEVSGTENAGVKYFWIKLRTVDKISLCSVFTQIGRIGPNILSNLFDLIVRRATDELNSVNLLVCFVIAFGKEVYLLSRTTVYVCKFH